ncbi:MAG: MetQ/NlpA family ABC transporter substrate-binding protein [Eubacteriales bacterium]|nr:MetQ/NlpA family ABC transporter substrate-binding protein [Eubacteriales bacterium]
MKKLIAILFALLIPFAAIAENVTVKVGVVGENNEQWEQLIIPTLKEEGIHIELVKFSDYIVPNQALFDGEVDLNAFQHKNFLANWNETYGGDLIPIGDTLVAPLCMYSEKIKSLDELKEGDSIAIMSDPVNEARALRMLESEGLIKLREDTTELATVADIIENKLNLTFLEMEAALTASALHDPLIAAGFLNGTHAKDAGYINDNALLIEKYDPENKDMAGIVNMIAAKESRKDEPAFKRIVEIYHSEEMRALFEEVYKDVYIPAF